MHSIVMCDDGVACRSVGGCRRWRAFVWAALWVLVVVVVVVAVVCVVTMAAAVVVVAVVVGGVRNRSYRRNGRHSSRRSCCSRSRRHTRSHVASIIIIIVVGCGGLSPRHGVVAHTHRDAAATQPLTISVALAQQLQHPKQE